MVSPIIAGLSETQFWTLALAILVSGASSFFSALIGSYAAKRGEHLATKADMDALRKQLADTTQITEQIKSDIEYSLARRKELETHKRVKLEQYCQSLYEAADSLSLEMNQKFFGSEAQADGHAFSRSSMLQKLYFPELAAQHAAFGVACADFRSWIVRGMEDKLSKMQAGNPSPLVGQEIMSEYAAMLKGVNFAVFAIEQEVVTIASELNAILSNSAQPAFSGDVVASNSLR
ncbi:hypothetical protein DFR24_0377 [Panacagrimonas perspica]|uniref:Uncharacterized protein n=2 Tax=Panacagrimonas perspica TaxID=381431 RepID=A0A4R7PBN4_9GAMM|nr:hypothetical protein DFR24_0377 [Panacagrimonas perspica]THD01832.1 hypothetical protein B1810_17680 [Panacagrimonas perspica]